MACLLLNTVAGAVCAGTDTANTVRSKENS